LLLLFLLLQFLKALILLTLLLLLYLAHVGQGEGIADLVKVRLGLVVDFW
jgi:hypothetical protein